MCILMQEKYSCGRIGRIISSTPGEFREVTKSTKRFYGAAIENYLQTMLDVYMKNLQNSAMEKAITNDRLLSNCRTCKCYERVSARNSVPQVEDW